MKIVSSIILLLSATLITHAANAQRRAEIPDNKLHIACAMRAMQAWQLESNERVDTSWQRISRKQWEFTLSHGTRKAICVIKENGEIQSFTDVEPAPNNSFKPTPLRGVGKAS